MGWRFNIIKIVPQLTYKAIVIAVITQGAFFFLIYLFIFPKNDKLFLKFTWKCIGLTCQKV